MHNLEKLFPFVVCLHTHTHTLEFKTDTQRFSFEYFKYFLIKYLEFGERKKRKEISRYEKRASI